MDSRGGRDCNPSGTTYETRPEKRTDREVHLLGFSSSLLSHEVNVCNAVGLKVDTALAVVGAVSVLDALITLSCRSFRMRQASASL